MVAARRSSVAIRFGAEQVRVLIAALERWLARHPEAKPSGAPQGDLDDEAQASKRDLSRQVL